MNIPMLIASIGSAIGGFGLGSKSGEDNAQQQGMNQSQADWANMMTGLLENRIQNEDRYMGPAMDAIFQNAANVTGKGRNQLFAPGLFEPKLQPRKNINMQLPAYQQFIAPDNTNSMWKAADPQDVWDRRTDPTDTNLGPGPDDLTPKRQTKDVEYDLILAGVDPETASYVANFFNNSGDPLDSSTSAHNYRKTPGTTALDGTDIPPDAFDIFFQLAESGADKDLAAAIFEKMAKGTPGINIPGRIKEK